ncbi:hypothetical protein [Ruegeria atlantica]|uniref:hypothetical protein n=1 Tax=Ruegeria atlantica TaxID=81569 RepID=UPI00147B6F46|nr:hypothetical protein [Ruegeria atlantica]
MSDFESLIKKQGYTVEQRRAGRMTHPRDRMLLQADNMLKKLASYKKPSQLDSKTSNSNWWSTTAVNGERMVCIKYGSKVVPNTSVYVTDTVADVTKAVEALKAAALEASEELWEAEEKRRAEAKKKNED